MKIIKIVYLIILTILISIPAISSAGDTPGTKGNWKQISNEDGIQAFERAIPGQKIKEFKGVANIEAGIDVISEVLKDIPSYPLWMAKCKETRLLKKFNNDVIVYYHENKCSWPVGNRGIILKSKIIFNPSKGITEILFKAIKDDKKYPVKDGSVQGVDLGGKIISEFVSHEITKMTYISIADPGGNISASMANNESKQYLINNLEGLRKMVKLKKYHELARKS